MRRHSLATTRLVALLLLHAAGAGLAFPSQTVTRPTRLIEWLPEDNQTVYRLEPGVVKKLELNTTSMIESPVFITVSPCTKNVHWAVYRGKSDCIDEQLGLVKEYSGPEMEVFFALMSDNERYVLQLTSPESGAAAVSVRGEKTKPVRLRLRVRSRRRLAANWDPSPIDPQATSYCVVASHRRNYTSLCAAQFDLKANRLENKSDRGSDSVERLRQYHRYDGSESGETSTEVDNRIDPDTDFLTGYDASKRIFRRRQFSRSTRMTEDPVIACVGDRTHHLIENLDPSTTYFVSVFGLGRDRRSGVLLASSSVRPRTSVAKRLRENVPFKTELKGRMVFYYKATVSSGDGLWLAVSTCGGPVDVEVLVRGKRYHFAKNIDPHQNFFVAAPAMTASVQETSSDEGSIQFDSSSSEEARIRYVIRVTPSRRERNSVISLEMTASTSRQGVSIPELAPDDGATVRELRPRRSCRSVEIAFLPASHRANDVIRYCVTAREMTHGGGVSCQFSKNSARSVCVNHSQSAQAKVIIQKLNGLKPGRKYAIQVTAASGSSIAIPYRMLYADTNGSCRGDETLGTIQSDVGTILDSLES